jgi:hypothetical protein
MQPNCFIFGGLILEYKTNALSKYTFPTFWKSSVASFPSVWTFRSDHYTVSKRCTPNTLWHSMTSVNIWHVIHTAEWNVNDHVQKTPSKHPTLTETNFVHLMSTAFSQTHLLNLFTQWTKLHVSANCTPFLRWRTTSHATCNVTLRSVRITIVPVKKH